MTTLRTLRRVATTAVTGVSALPAQGYWNAFEAENIVDRHPQSIVDARADKGVKVERLEEVNDLVLAFVVEEDGRTSLSYFDPNQGYAQVQTGGP